MTKKRFSLFSIASVLAFPFLIYLISVKKLKPKPDKGQATDCTEQAKEGISPSRANLLRPDKDAKAPKHRKTGGQAKENPSKKWRWPDATRMQAIFTGLIFFVTAAYAYISYRQWQIMKQTLNIVERPYITVKEIKLNGIAVGQTPTVEVFFENTGRTPALNATFNVYVDLRETFIPDDPAGYPTLANIPVVGFIPSGGVQEVRATNKRLIITEEELKKITEKKLILSVFGTGEYNDGLLNTKRFKFCRFYDKDAPSQINICVLHNIYE